MKVYNTFFDNDHRPRIMTQKFVRQETRLPKTTVHDVFKRFLKMGRIRKVPTGYELTYMQLVGKDDPYMSPELEKQIERRRKEIEVRESKRIPEAFPTPKSGPWYQEISKKNPVRSNRRS